MCICLKIPLAENVYMFLRKLFRVISFNQIYYFRLKEISVISNLNMDTTQMKSARTSTTYHLFVYERHTVRKSAKRELVVPKLSIYQRWTIEVHDSSKRRAENFFFAPQL